MSSNGKTGYELRHLANVAEEIKDLTNQAVIQGNKPELLAALKAALDKLRTQPSSWGDPEYNLKKPGGCAYHGIMKPVIVHYVVFEHEKIVLIRNIRWLASSEGD